MLKTWRNTKNVYLFDYVFISPIFPFILEEDSKFKKGAQALGNPHCGPYWLHIGQKGAAKAECQLK